MPSPLLTPSKTPEKKVVRAVAKKATAKDRKMDTVAVKEVKFKGEAPTKEHRTILIGFSSSFFSFINLLVMVYGLF